MTEALSLFADLPARKPAKVARPRKPMAPPKVGKFGDMTPIVRRAGELLMQRRPGISSGAISGALGGMVRDEAGRLRVRWASERAYFAFAGDVCRAYGETGGLVALHYIGDALAWEVSDCRNPGRPAQIDAERAKVTTLVPAEASELSMVWALAHAIRREQNGDCDPIVGLVCLRLEGDGGCAAWRSSEAMEAGALFVAEAWARLAMAGDLRQGVGV